MAYKIEIPKKMLRELFLLREYCGGPSIVQGIREAVAEYLQKKEREIGDSIESVAETIEQHHKEKKGEQEL